MERDHAAGEPILGSSPHSSRLRRAPTGLRFIWLELTSRCNLRCLHCYAASGPSEGAGELTTPDWKRVIQEAASLGCQAIQFTGGEPLLHPDLLELVGYAREQGYRFLEVFTNATLLGPREIASFAGHGVHLAISFYSHRPAVHDRVTGVNGSFLATSSHLKELVRRGIPVRVAVIVMKENPSEVEETLRFLEGLGIAEERIGIDEVRPTGRGRDPRRALESPSTFGPPPVGRAWRACLDPGETSTCWAGKLCVTSAGRAIPCIFARDLPVGDLRQASLEEIIAGERLQTLWGITLDEVKGCRDCEYRYACWDCRALPYTRTGDLYARSPRCHYDPYRAEASLLAKEARGEREESRPMRPLPERPRRRAHVITRVLEDEGILYDPATHSVHSLNPTAALVWDLCDGEHTLSDIVDLLGEIFEAEREEVAADVQETLKRLQRLGLLEELEEEVG